MSRLCTLSMFLTGKPRRMIGYIMGIFAVFLICSYLTKTAALFVGNAVNLAVHLSVGGSVHLLALADGVDSMAAKFVWRKTDAL